MNLILPNNLDTERALLGGLFFNPESIHELRLSLQPEDFFSAVHRKVYSSMLGLADQDQPIEITVLSDALDKVGDLKKIGGNDTLMNLTSQVPSGQAVLIHGKTIADLSLRRRLVQAAGKIMEDTPTAPTGSEALDKAEADIFSLRERRHLRIVGGNEAAVQAVREIEKVYKAGGNLIGLPTSLDWLDHHTMGLCPGDLIVIGARPSDGKSAFALQLAYHNASREKTVLFVSLEMQPERLMMRLFASQSQMDLKDIRAAKLDGQGWARLTGATTSIQETGGPYLWFMDAHRCGIIEVASVARHLSRSKALDLIVIDYLQRMNADDLGLPKGTLRHREIGTITNKSKGLARELGLPVVMLSQIRRSGDEAPTMGDLKESGDIEQDADIILLLHKDKDNSSSVEFILAKQRDGEIAKTPMYFDGAHQTFKGRIMEGKEHASQW